MRYLDTDDNYKQKSYRKETEERDRNGSIDREDHPWEWADGTTSACHLHRIGRESVRLDDLKCGSPGRAGRHRNHRHESRPASQRTVNSRD